RATLVIDWLPTRVSSHSWSPASQISWDLLRERGTTLQETSTIHTAFKQITEGVTSEMWEFNDILGGWEGTTQNFVLRMKGRVLTPCNIGCLVELTGQDDDADYLNRSHKAKFIRDLLRLHVL